ncbi:adenine phosphoribosyltransferase [Helicobacter sp. 13S00401-1]|uniref:adenine phosphoribosyltransferase n=1 Tax=Helicobacter sp. 13S00401-1 TaxID=1905758 RepID=UPI000BA715A8|nr:adenine phosphoribosyltransferase [Helicobacter sp. 13S00401-1]PAF49057.1 adenine phosphoribosyltransferase [Helicobacter sp. 13S00401-1]
MAKHHPSLKDRINDSIRTIKDFPKKGIDFKDITTFLQNGVLFSKYIDFLAARYAHFHLDYVLGIESRGFIFASALAYKLQCGFVPIRKKGKLPGKTIEQSYALEYGSDIVEIHVDAFHGAKDAKVVILDDLLATGGTAAAALKLVNALQGKCIECSFLMNLSEFDSLESKQEFLKVAKVFSLLEC